jgi:ArsR family transcriptional regulator
MNPKLDPKTKARFTARANVLKAMAHPSRLFMVEQLSKGEECVCKLAEMIGVDMSTASKHLSLLKHVGIVEDEKRGSMVFYRLRAPRVMDCMGWVEHLLKDTAEQHAEVAK